MDHTKQKRKVLFIGYDRNLAILHGGILQKLGDCEVSAADTAEYGRELYSKGTFDVVVLGTGITPQQRDLLAVEIRGGSRSTEIVILPEAALL